MISRSKGSIEDTAVGIEIYKSVQGKRRGRAIHIERAVCRLFCRKLTSGRHRGEEIKVSNNLETQSAQWAKRGPEEREGSTNDSYKLDGRGKKRN